MRFLLFSVVGLSLGVAAYGQQVWRNTSDPTGLDTLSVGFAPGFPPRSEWETWPEVGTGYQLNAPAVLTEVIVYANALTVNPLSYRSGGQVAITIYANDGPAVMGTNGTIFNEPKTVLSTNFLSTLEMRSGRQCYRFPVRNIQVPEKFTIAVIMNDSDNETDTGAHFSLPYYSGVEVGGLQGNDGVVFQRVRTRDHVRTPWFAQEKPANYPFARFALGGAISVGDPYVNPIVLDYSPGASILGYAPLGDSLGNTSAAQTVTLEGGRHKIEQLDFGYFNYSTTNQGEFRIGLHQIDEASPYHADGGEPLSGGEIWLSDWMPLETSESNFVRKTISVPGVTVPATFAWAMEVRGLIGTDTAGPALVNPGTIGATPNEYMLKNASGWMKVADTAGTSLGTMKVTSSISERLLPIRFDLQLGITEFGRLRELRYSEGQALQTRKFFTPGVTSPEHRSNTYFLPPYSNPSSIKVTVRSRYVSAGLYRQDIYLVRPNNSVLKLRTDTMTPNFQVFEATVTDNPGQFVNPSTGLIRVMVDTKQTGPSVDLFPAVAFDAINIEVMP